MENGVSTVSKTDEDQAVERERQEGDGNDNNCSPSLRFDQNARTTIFSADKDLPSEEKPGENKKEQDAKGEKKKEETMKISDTVPNGPSQVEVGKKNSRVREKSNDFANEKSAKLSTSSCSTSFKELRQQLKQLYGHELIRRILQTSPAVTNSESLLLPLSPSKSLNAVSVNSVHYKERPPETFDKQESLERNCKSTKQAAERDCPDLTKEKPVNPSRRPLVQEEKGEQVQLETKDKRPEQEITDKLNGHTCCTEGEKYCSAQPKASDPQQASYPTMQGSRSGHDDKDKQSPHHDGSDHSDSVVSLQSSSSDDGKPRREASLEEADVPVIRAESVGDMDEPKESNDTEDCGGVSNHNVDRLQQKIQDQPTQDTLDEILHMLKNQNAKDNSFPSHDSADQRLGSQLLWHQDSALEGTSFRSSQMYPSTLGWNTSVPPLQLTVGQMSGHQKLREKHSRQLKDVTIHYETEIEKLRDQLDEVRNNLTVLQESLPVRMLETENNKLEARCHMLEQVCEQMKNKQARLEQAHQELEGVCGQLKQVNQSLEVRCLYLEQVNQTNESERSHLQQNIRELEAKVLELVESSERAIRTCHHLEDANHKCEARNQALEESRALLETRYKNCFAENQKLDAHANQLQKTLEESTKKCKELEDSLVILHRKKEGLAVELEASNKVRVTTQQRFEEMKSMCNSKDELIAKLENEMRDLSNFVEKTIKEKAQAEQDSKRDRELLQRMLIEYDVLAKNHLEARNSSRAVQDKLDLSQDEINSLRGTISKLISRNNSLEESLKDVSNQESKPSDYLKPFSGRRTWDHSTPIKKAEGQVQGLRAPYAVTEPERRSLGTSSANSRPCSASPGTTAALLLSDRMATKTSTPIGKKQEMISPRSKSASPAGLAKRNLLKGFGEGPKETSDSKQSSSHKTPGMIMKKADLVTRFDVVFEDSKSGQEVMRTHTGRTTRSYGEPAHTDLSFVDGEEKGHKSTAEAALSAVKEGRVVAMGDPNSKNTSRGSKSKQQQMYNVPEKALSADRTRTTSNEKPMDADESDIHLMERRFSVLSEERKRLESTLSRIPSQKMTKRTKEDKAYLEDRLDDVVKEIGAVRMQLKRHHAL